MITLVNNECSLGVQIHLTSTIVLHMIIKKLVKIYK